MKKNIFITTSITIFLVQLLVFPFALTASAMESGSVAPLSAEMSLTASPAGQPSIHDLNIYPLDNIPSDGSVRGDFYSWNRDGIFPYDYVMAFSANFQPVLTPVGWIHLNYGVPSFKEFNSVSFDVGVWVEDTEDYNTKDYFRVMFNDEPVTDGIVIKYYFSSVFADVGPPPHNTPARYRKLTIQVFFEEPYKYDSLDVDLYVRTYLPPFAVPIRYLIGVSSLEYEKISEQEFVAGIASDVANIDNKLGETNEKLGIIGDTMTDIKDILSAGLSDEESQKIMDSREQLENNAIILETYEENIEAVDEELNFYFESYDSIEYDLFGDTYMNHVEEYVEPVFENDPFMGFWYGFFSHPFVIAMIIVSLTFCAVGFVMYGVR